jgi:hypothetical protein
VLSIIKTWYANKDHMRGILPVLMSLILHHATAASYFSTHGAFNNSCRVTECSTCGTGQYRLGCANASLGTCTSGMRFGTPCRLPTRSIATAGGFLFRLFDLGRVRRDTVKFFRLQVMQRIMINVLPRVWSITNCC